MSDTFPNDYSARGRVPYRAPSVRTLMARLEIDRDQARAVLALLKGEVNPNDPDRFPRTVAWLRRCYHAPHVSDAVLHAVDEVLETFGVEGWATSAYEGVSYCNTGDTYAPTVCLLPGNRWAVAAWGDLVHRYPHA